MRRLYERYGKWVYGLLGLVLLTVAARSALAIAEHGVAGWLSGDAGFQTRAEIVATVLLVVALLTVTVAIAWRFGDFSLSHWREWRLVRAIKRARREAESRRS